MKLLDRIALVIFSIMILVLAMITCFVIFGWVSISTISIFFLNMLNNQVCSNIVLVVSILFMLLAIKCIFFTSNSREPKGSKDGILLENESGKLLISRETLENLVNGVVKGFESAENVTSRIYLDKQNNLKVYVTLFVHPNAVIKDLSANLQNRIKDAIKKTSDLEVEEVNIRVRNIASKAEAIDGK